MPSPQIEHAVTGPIDSSSAQTLLSKGLRWAARILEVAAQTCPVEEGGEVPNLEVEEVVLP